MPRNLFHMRLANISQNVVHQFFMQKKAQHFEHTLTYLLPLLVLLAAFFFTLGGRFIPAIGSYY